MKAFMAHNFTVSKVEVACYVAPGDGASVHRNRSSHGLVLPTDGQKTYVFESGQCVRTDENHILYLPQGSDYTVQLEPPAGCYAINFSLPVSVNFSPFAVRIKNKAMFLDCFKHAENAWRTKPSGYEMRCMSELYRILFELRREYEAKYTSRTERQLLEAAVAYIHSHYTTEVIAVPHLAMLCGISETYFRRLFHNTFGLSPLKYIKDLRITRAKELLSSGIYTVSEAAEMSGWRDECYFSREFKKAVGICPSEYGIEA